MAPPDDAAGAGAGDSVVGYALGVVGSCARGRSVDIVGVTDTPDCPGRLGMPQGRDVAIVEHVIGGVAMAHRAARRASGGADTGLASASY